MSVVITGVGLCTPLGTSREQSWQNLLKPEKYARADRFALPEKLPDQPQEITRLEWLAWTIAREAISDAGFSTAISDPEIRWGSVIGTSKGPLEHYHREVTTTDKTFDFTQLWPSAPGAYCRRQLEWTGPALCPVSACATGLDAVLRGVRLIEQGDCDFVLAGSVDASINNYLLASYRRLGVLAGTNHHPSQACRPFDVHRDGFVIGEGGALFVLARDDHPAVIKNQIYARWIGGLSASDPTGLTQLDESGLTLSRMLGQLLIQSGLRTSQIDLIQLHGTGTVSNDLAESRAIRSLFGPSKQQPWSTASKGKHGHALGASGSIELAWLLLSLRDGMIPPIWNCDQLDPACPIRPVLQQPLATSLHIGMKISLGFGGHQVAALLERGDRPSIEPRC